MASKPTCRLPPGLRRAARWRASSCGAAGPPGRGRRGRSPGGKTGGAVTKTLGRGEETAGHPSPAFFLFRLFFFNDTATTEIYTLSLHDALPISPAIV